MTDIGKHPTEEPKMKNLTIFMLFLLFALSVPLAAMADVKGGDKDACNSSCMKHMEKGRGMEGRHGGFGRWGHAKMFRLPWFYLAQAKDLKLSDEQKASLKKISFELKKEMITKGADVKMKTLELREMLATPEYKLEDATAKLKDVSDARLALETTLLQYSVQARDILTPDQLKGLKDLHGHDRHHGKEMKRHMRDNEEEK